MVSAHQQLRILQKSLYEKAYRDAHALATQGHRSIIRYSDKFEASLPRDFSVVNQEKLLSAMRKNSFLLYGDFHTLRQAQRGFIRLVRAYIQKYSNSSIVVALEAFKASDQDILDRFLNGRVSEAEFLAETRYFSYWGFPWQNFKMILDFCRDLSLDVIGINTDRAGADSLQDRDRFAAELLIQAKEKFPTHKIVCLIGEYHLADAHLPRQIKLLGRKRVADPSFVRVLTNVDQYYFEVSEQRFSTSTQYLQLKKDMYCIMNSPPWLKWQSYAIFEETRGYDETVDFESPTLQFDPEFDPYTEHAFDIDEHFLSLVKNLSFFLGLKIPKSDLANFHIFTGTQLELIQDLINSRDNVDPDSIERITERAIMDGVYFLERTNTVILTSISVNNLAEASGQFLHKVASSFQSDEELSVASFYRRVVKSFVGMFASMIFNPRRKCMEIYHFRRFLYLNHKRRLEGPALLKRVTAQAVLKHHTWMLKAQGRSQPSFSGVPRSIFRLDLETHFEISRRIGQLLGHAFYRHLMSGRIASHEVRSIFHRQFMEASELQQFLFRMYNFIPRN